MRKIDNKKFLQEALRWMAVLVLKKYNPRVVSITGSVGKTSTKDAVFAVLASNFRVRRSEKNYNNEIGIPLTIIGATSGQGSIIKWLGVFFKWLAVIILPLEYPEILVLEMGADRPGDIKYFTDFIDSEVSIITDISMSHMEYFKSVEDIAKTKGVLVKSLSKKSLAILNIDNHEVAKLKDQVDANLITISIKENSDMQATDVAFVYAENESTRPLKGMGGISFKLNYKGVSIPVRLNNILAKHQIYPALIASAVGTWFGLNLVEIAATLENFITPCGRMNLIEGIKNSLIIDDTYNSSPVSAVAALETLQEIAKGRKVIALGDMLELGIDTEKFHREVGKKICEIRGDIFVAMGRLMKFAADEMISNGFDAKNIFYFDDPVEAGKFLDKIIKEHDVILIKGSQGMRMEKTVEEIMHYPQQAIELLCRQNPEWRSMPFRK